MGLYVFGIPIVEDAKEANARREDREDRKDIGLEKTVVRQSGRTGRTDLRQSGRTGRTDLRQDGRTSRTGLRCADGSCGAEDTIRSIGDAAGGILSQFGAGAAGPLPYVAAGAIALVAGFYVYQNWE